MQDFRRENGSSSANDISRRLHLPRSPLLRISAGLAACITLVLLASHQAPEQSSAAVDYVRYVKSTTQQYWSQGFRGVNYDDEEANTLSRVTQQRVEEEPTVGADAPKIHVAVEEKAGYHSEVWPSYVYTLSRLPNVRTSVFLYGGDQRPKSNHMKEIARSFYNETTSYWGTLLEKLPLEDEDRIDVVISTTCTETLAQKGKELLEIHDARKTKFRLICTVHHGEPDDLAAFHSRLVPWVKRDSLVLLGLSDHTTRSVRNALGSLAVKWNYAGDVSYDKVPVHTLVPIFPVPEAIVGGRTAPKRPNRAVIQGKVNTMRRNYKGIFSSLVREIEADPKLWGWTVPAEPSLPFTKDDSVEDPFSLILMGHIEQQGLIPDRLKKVVEVKADFDYNKYYDTIHQIGLVIPAFAKTDYYTNSASSSIAAAVLARTPILATRYHLEAYSYLDSRGVILHPDNIDPIQAIGRLRSKGTTLSDSEEQILAGSTVADAYTTQRRNDEMLAMSEKVYKTNLISMDKMLRTPLPDYSFIEQHSGDLTLPELSDFSG